MPALANVMKSAYKTVENAGGSALKSTLEHARNLGKAHGNQLKFTLKHPVLAAVTSKTGQQTVRQSARFIDNALRPIEVRAVQTTAGNVVTGVERGLPSGKLPAKADEYLAIKQAEKDGVLAGKGTGNVKHLDDVPRIKEVEVNFKRNDKHDSEEFARQLKDQEKGMNELTVDEYLKNREKYIEQGRAIEGNAAQQAAREEAYVQKINELQREGLTLSKAKKQAKEWLDTQAALHNPDQIAGGKAEVIGGLGDKRINSSIGSQWRYRIDIVDEQIKELAKSMTPE
ncbi:hypothetical protein HNQ42_002194 [Rummeliibacillus stabekisii]|nr:hypothetical protein [Rummeliibacillus stabekisii]GEL05967.1 hypothetical protein RST01_25940 [Rummeliibacillus stabekisii]